ncbi:MAG: hypothetical protein LBL33_03305 [Tannerella sp.]|nr:hypothetical protein [Tannerella sp.]
MKYNTGSGYAPSLLRNAQPVRGYAGQLCNMSYYLFVHTSLIRKAT